jgi:hypothetical protein
MPSVERSLDAARTSARATPYSTGYQDLASYNQRRLRPVFAGAVVLTPGTVGSLNVRLYGSLV